MQRITPFLWFEHEAEEAMNFYVAIFPNSKIHAVSRYGDAGPGPKGSVMTANFELDGQSFIALNGGPIPNASFNQAVSFVVNCETQEEVDHYWDKLSAGGKTIQCGWLNDKFGVPWQIVPTALGALMTDPDPATRNRVMQAMMKMVKLDIAALHKAANGTD